MAKAKRATSKISDTAQKALQLQGRREFQEAEKLWKSIVSENPDDADARYNLGLCLRYNGRLSEALLSLAHVIKMKPSAEAHLAMGRTYRELQILDRASQSIEQALALDEHCDEAWAEMALLHCMQNKPEHAILLAQKAIETKGPDSRLYKHLISVIFRDFKPKAFSEQLKSIILDGLQTPHIFHENYTNAWTDLLIMDPLLMGSIRPLLQLSDEDFACKMRDTPNPAFLHDPYFYLGLRKLKIPSVGLENFFEHLRRFFLNSILDHSYKSDYDAVLFALSTQCFFNEYVYTETEAEKKIVSDLEQETDLNPEKLAALGCYRPLYSLKNAASISASIKKKYKDHTELNALIKTQIDEPFEERSIKEKIKSIGTIHNAISVAVQEQYEENPYPRWQDYASLPQGSGEFGRISFQNFECRSMLIAGCGTGKQIAINKLTFPYAAITAIDISRASLAYAIRKCAELELENISFFHADILELKELGQSFDLIACSGVLHHMEDPFAGWKVLTDILNPGGYMNIGLYSDAARTHIVKAREFIAENKYPSTAEGIRACRTHIKSLPPSNLVFGVTKSPDFFALSSCRDLIFHVQEHRYNIEKIAENTNRLGLKFVAMPFASVGYAQRYRTAFPDDPQMRNLANLDRFEKRIPGAFAGMYQFWVHKPLK